MTQTSSYSSVAFAPAELVAAIGRSREPMHIVRHGSGPIGLAFGDGGDAPGIYARLATLPPLYPEWLGDRSFAETHGTRFPYVVGDMANGISTVALVIAAARAGVLGFFGAAGLAADRVATAIDELTAALGTSAPWGVNLIHSPSEPELENRVAELLIARGVARISASAFMALTPAVVRCAAAGLRVDASGAIVRARHIFAKVSRPEVARHFLAPAPEDLLRALVERGQLTTAEAQLAARVPIAEDLTVEADSGGHTDNQPLVALLPTILALRDRIAGERGYARPIRIGAAGGLGTPTAVAAAFALGAAYVLTGSINQAAVESGLSADGKAMLARAELADVMMAPAADMFELGVEVQVLKRGTMFGVRAARLADVYRAHASLDEIAAPLRAELERDTLHASFDDVWRQTRQFWAARDPRELARAETDGKHRMALAFRWYLGSASQWAIAGDPARRADYQIWCGPAMGAFNAWARGSFLEDVTKRSVAQIALNLLEGASVVTRAHQCRTYGVAVPAAAFDFRPRLLG